jgi:L-lactate dehydrogenase complex protein LldG
VSAAVQEPRSADPAVLELFAERLTRAHIEVRRVAAGEVAAEVARVCTERGVCRLGVPPGLPAEWRPAGAGHEAGTGLEADPDGVIVAGLELPVELVEDHELSPGELDNLDGALTGCTLAVAETGSLVLAAGSADGRRALSLVPDVYLCVVCEDQVVPDLAMVLIAALVKETGRPVVFVSGPSATSDIELHRVEGVHGPRQLVVLLVSA